MGSTLQEDLDQAVFDKDETDEKYKEMMKERLKLERSYAQIQVRLGTVIDVERDKIVSLNCNQMTGACFSNRLDLSISK